MVTAVNTGQFTSPYLPAPYAPEAVNGLTGRWSWDPATLSIKGVDTNSRDQQYVVISVAPQLTAGLLAEASGPVQRVPEQFLRPPANVPEIVRSTADAVTAGSHHTVCAGHGHPEVPALRRIHLLPAVPRAGRL